MRLAPVFRTLVLSLLVAVVVSCSTDRPHETVPPEAPSGQVQQSLDGTDGVVAVTAPNTVLNEYAVLANDASAGDSSIDVEDIDDLDSASFGPLEANDLVLIIQMQGADIATGNNASYGNVQNLQSAGLHEFAAVVSVAGDTIEIDTSAGGLVNSYTSSDAVQVVRVPQLSAGSVAAGASISAPAWDGERGGIVALRVANTLTVEGAIDVSARGFRGGAVDNGSQDSDDATTTLRSTDNDDGGEKGESIAGDFDDYQNMNGAYGRGAPANGGGGGTSHNGAGGGGSNGNNGNVWTGAGVMPGGVVGAAAWVLDPAYSANGNALTNSSGGGRGGYSFSSNDEDALTVGPNDSDWGGNDRRNVGGLGGRPLDNSTAGRLFFGGGGGAGDGNNASAGRGGNGGGLVYIIAETVAGGGSVLANGEGGADAVNEGRDAAGGGGGGGTIVINAQTLSGVTLTAGGGTGGDQNILGQGFGNEAEGPGAGGGGGFIAIAGGAVTATAAGGSGGLSDSPGVTEFPTNGATDGASGQPDGIAGPPVGTFCEDSDEDGIPDDVEVSEGTDPFDADSDDDGVEDGDEPDWDEDSDGDGLINALDPDSDDDGLFDGTELGLDCSHPDTDVSRGNCVPDGDQGQTTTDPLNPDTDGGGVRDGAEDFNLDGVVDAGETDPTSGNGGDDSTVVDTDGDGLSDGEETFLGSDPNDADTDDDGLLDGDEHNPSSDTDGDGLINLLDVDADDDGLFDGTEKSQGCDHPDTDAALGHCIPDADTTNATFQLVADSDGGGEIDGSEDCNRNGAVDGMETDPNDDDDDDDVVDADDDGLSDCLETEIGSDPNDGDSDDDGVLDGDEPNPGDDHDGDGNNNVVDEDSDDDGLFDGTEVGNDCDHPDTDPNAGDCIPDADGGGTTTNPLDADTDDGGVPDGEEDANHNGAIDPGERDPNDGADDNGGTGGAGGGGGSGSAAGGAGGAGGATSAAGGNGGGGDTVTNGLFAQGGCNCTLSTQSPAPGWAAFLLACAALASRRTRHRANSAAART